MTRTTKISLLGFGNAVAGFSLFLSLTAAAETSSHGPVILEKVTSGLDRPIYVTAPPGESDRLFLVEQSGTVRLFDRIDEELREEPFLDISDEVPSLSGGDERGLLGLAFHPDYANTGRFYINFTDLNANTVIRRYQVSGDPDIADAGSAEDLLTVSQPFGNHNGGWMGFGPDGYLYIASGDGGSGNDPQDHGQRTETLLGAMLRIDSGGDDFPEDTDRNYAIPADNPFADGDDGIQDPRPEIWAYGLRNPWRASFDRETGDLWIADVGQSEREEINFQPADSPGGENYGWRIMEGTHFTGNDPGASTEDLIDPIHEYDFSDGRKAIIGGYVYRGKAMPHLRGSYFYADYMADFVESLRYDGETVSDFTDWTDAFTDSSGNLIRPTSFGEDPDGELYLTTLTGDVYRITQPPWYLWRNREFSEEQLEDPDLSDPEATPAGDGVSNLMKYALGLPPLEPAGRLPIETDIREFDGQPHLTMTVEKSPEATDITFVIEISDDLGVTDPWSAEETTVVTDTGELLVVRTNAPTDQADRHFLRLRVVRND